jgi:hypothetical protein
VSYARVKELKGVDDDDDERTMIVNDVRGIQSSVAHRQSHTMTRPATIPPLSTPSVLLVGK